MYSELYSAEPRPKIRRASRPRSQVSARRFHRTNSPDIRPLPGRGSYEQPDAASRQPGNDQTLYDSVPGPGTGPYRHQVGILFKET